MTNAFSTRRQNKEKIEDLRRSIQHELDEMADLRDDSKSRYNEYIYQLKKILPIKEELSLPAKVIAARLSDDKDEQCSIRASLRSLGCSAECKRQYIDGFSALPALKTSKRTTTRHFAELDDEGSVIRQWDAEKPTTTYYLDKKG